MRKAILTILAWFSFVGSGCSSHEAMIVDRDVVLIQPEALVIGAKVLNKMDATWVTGTLAVNPQSDNHLHGLLHVEVFNANQELTEHLDLCFNSIWRKPGYRVPGSYERPRFEVMLSKNPEPGSVIHFRPELDHPKCRQKHEIGAEVVEGSHS